MKKIVAMFALIFLFFFVGNAFSENSTSYSDEEWVVTGDENTFIGVSAGSSNTANANTFLGYQAGWHNTTGHSNTFLGRCAGSLNFSGFQNTFIGRGAGFNNTASENTFMGYYSGLANTSGQYNTFIGSFTGLKNKTASNNTFVGTKSGTSNTTGYGNNFVGVNAGFYNTTGYRNTFQGNNAGRNNTTGYGNTFIGTSAGYSNTTGNSNVFIGYYAGYNEAGSNKLYIDNSDTATPLIYGDFAADTVEINGTLCAIVECPSSREYKKNIQELNAQDAMEALQRLTPVTYNYKKYPDENHVGFIAEDVPDLVATKDHKRLSSLDFVAVLTKVVQEQQVLIKELQGKNDKLEQRLLVLEGK